MLPGVSGAPGGMLTVVPGELTALVHAWLFPFLRIAAVVMSAPAFSGGMVSGRVRILLALSLTGIIVPLLPAAPQVAAFSVAGVLLVVQQLLVGVALGFAVQIVFDALIVAGQAIAMSMGLGFAMAIDPQRGVNVPVVSQYFVVLATLTYFSINGHYLLIDALVDSFTSIPIGEPILGDGGSDLLWTLVSWVSQMFAGAVQIALPAMAALMMVNLAFGVISRAAPSLNLFAVGFPITMLLGFLILIFSMPNIIDAFARILAEVFNSIDALLAGRSAP